MDKTEMIKEMILNTKMSMKAFAQKADLPYTSLRSILERGIENASVNNIIKICRALNISVDKLYDINDFSSLSYDESEIIKLFNGLNDSGKREALKRMKELGQLLAYKDTEPTTNINTLNIIDS